MTLIIDKNLCPQNHHCPMVDQCPVEAISQHKYELPVIDADKCINCGKCGEICGMKAVITIDN